MEEVSEDRNEPQSNHRFLLGSRKPEVRSGRNEKLSKRCDRREGDDAKVKRQR